MGFLDSSRARWAVWILSSAAQAGLGVLIAWGLVALFPVLKNRISLAFGFCGVATLAAAGAMLAFPPAFQPGRNAFHPRSRVPSSQSG